MESYRLRHRKSFRIKKRKSIFKRKIFWFFLFFLIIFGAGIYYGFYYKIFEIKEILISGNKKVKTEEAKLLIEEKITHKIFFIETKNIFLANIKEIQQALLLKFPRIQTIDISKDWLGILSVKITEREPVGNLCNLNSCYLFDKEGVIFEAASQDSEILMKIEPQEQQLTLGKQEISREIVRAILEIDKLLKENFLVKPEEITLSLNRATLEIKTSEGWKIYFEIQGDIEAQILNLNLFLKEKIKSQERKNLDYIDLRYGNKIFYKKK